MSLPVLALQGVSKRFGPIEVLHSIDLTLRSGEVHALIGENGAGKSTTMKILAGYQPASEGEILLNGAPVIFDTLHDGEEAGIVMIHQEFNLAEQLSVEQNIFLGRELKKGWLLNKSEMRRRTRAYLERVECAVDPDALVSSLSNSDKQMVEIAKALSRDARVLIMDEPTSVLTPAEVSELFATLKRLAEEGMAILYISHKLEEIRQLCDEATILRLGRKVAEADPRAESARSLASLMMGSEVPIMPANRQSSVGEILL